MILHMQKFLRQVFSNLLFLNPTRGGKFFGVFFLN